MEQVTITFDLSNEVDAKVYYVVNNLSRYYKKFYNLDNLTESEALIRYIHDVGKSLLDCEKRKEKCERVLDVYARQHAQM
jgi:hypothetical protein